MIRAREALRDCLPEALRGQAFSSLLRTEEAVQRWLTTLLKNINENSGSTQPSQEGDANQSLNFMTNLTINDASAFKMSTQTLAVQSQNKLTSAWGK